MVEWKIFIVCAILLTENAKSVVGRSSILEGFGASIEDFPYQASIRLNGGHVCDGTIISERHILTAGHCIVSNEGPIDSYYTVLTGTSHRYTDPSFPSNSHKMANVTFPPKFVSYGNYDNIAIITLKDTIVFDKYQQKINLSKENFKVGQKANLTSWGRFQGRLQRIPYDIELDQLLQFQTEIISLEKCQQSVLDPESTKINDTEVCINNPDKSGLCYGDAGGPLVANNELIGIASWTDGSYCGGNYPTVLTNVYKFKDFIEYVIKDTV